MIPLNLEGRRSTPLIRQSEAAECGLACIAMVASFHGHQVDLSTLRRRFEISLKGATLATLMRTAEALRFSTRAARCEPGDFAMAPLPLILHWKLAHFVVLTGVKSGIRGNRYRIHDPAVGALDVDEATMSRNFSGVCLELTPADGFKKKREIEKVALFRLFGSMPGVSATIIQAVVLSVVLQIVALAMPFYLQTAVDTVVPATDTELLTVLALGFGGVVIIQYAAQWLRSLVLLKLGASFGYRLVVNLYRQMMRLPLGWFERRHVGDVVSRFSSTQPVVQLLSQGLIAAVLDAAMTTTTLILLLVYSPVLAGVAVVALTLFICLRLGWLKMLRARNVSVIATTAAEQSTFIESIRGIAAIKAFADEDNRQRLWQHRKAAAVNAQISSGRLQAGFDATQAAVLGLEQVVFVYLAIKMTMSGTITIGMVLAFQAYKQQFMSSAMRVIQSLIDWQMAEMHLGRLSDIALAKDEAGADGLAAERAAIEGRIVLRNVGFRYAPDDPWIVRRINLVVEPGDTVLLTGPSGGGKTTLMKIMLGLLEPTEGEVLIDGVSLKHYGKQAYRSQVGTVMQDDGLFAGSIAENIALFDPAIDMARVREVAGTADIATEIEAMPMAYESLIGDMGSSLSGGQRQRILLARALYRRPAIVFGDELTGSLDQRAHAAVVRALGSLDATRILVTHRAIAIPDARQICVERGSLTEVAASPKPHDGGSDQVQTAETEQTRAI